MKTSQIGTLFVALCVLAPSAKAGDIASKVRPYSQFDWTGGTIGIVAGGSFLDGSTRFLNPPGIIEPDSAAGFIGAKANYAYQFDNGVVLGMETSLVALFNKGQAPVGPENWHVNADWSGTVTARVGYAHGRLLPYAKGGISFLHLDDLQYDGSILPPSTPLDHTYVGWTLGVGVDYAATNNWIIGLDYSYADFGGHNFASDTFCPGCIGDTIVEPGIHLISASLSYKY